MNGRGASCFSSFLPVFFLLELFVALNFAGAKVRNSAWTVSPTLPGFQKLNSDASNVKERNAKELNRPSETSEKSPLVFIHFLDMFEN